MRRSNITQAIIDGRTTALLLAHPIECTQHQQCTLGPHEWDATRNMTPGPRAQSFEPSASNGYHPTDDDAPADTTAALHDKLNRLLDQWHGASRNLNRFLNENRPDRYTHLPNPPSDDHWCTNHPDHGICEPRGQRLNLCRWCYDIGQAYGTHPDDVLIRAHQHTRHVTTRDLDDFAHRTRTPTKKRKAKAR